MIAQIILFILLSLCLWYVPDEFNVDIVGSFRARSSSEGLVEKATIWVMGEASKKIQS